MHDKFYWFIHAFVRCVTLPFIRISFYPWRINPPNTNFKFSPLRGTQRGYDICDSSLSSYCQVTNDAVRLVVSGVHYVTNHFRNKFQHSSHSCPSLSRWNGTLTETVWSHWLLWYRMLSWLSKWVYLWSEPRRRHWMLSWGRLFV